MKTTSIPARSTDRQYRLRTEYQCDCPKIIAILRPWLEQWLEANGLVNKPIKEDAEGYIWIDHGWSEDTEVQFTIKQGGPSLNEIRWLINLIPDGHVPAESLAPLPEYTGERIHFELVREKSERPSPEIINLAVSSLERTVAAHKYSEGDTADTIETLQAHLGNPEPHMRKVAARYAKILTGKSTTMAQMDSIKLANLFFENMTFDKNGVQCHM